MPSLIRWAARQFIPGLASFLDTPTAIVNEIKSMGFSYTNQTMFRDVNEYLDIMKFGSFFREAASLGPAPDELYARSYSMRRDRRYLVAGRATLKDNVSGELSDRPVSYYTDRKLSGEDEIGAVQDYLTGLERYGADFQVVAYEKSWGKLNMRLFDEAEIEAGRKEYLRRIARSGTAAEA